MATSSTKQSSPAKQDSWSVPLRHSTYRLVNDKCPACGYPEAPAGYCENCGWTQFDPTCPHCRKEQGK